jgi:Flp pilus assembly secretin CpaC
VFQEFQMPRQSGAIPSKLMRVAFLGLAIASVSPAAYAAELLDITIDFARVLTLPRPAETIVVGNPGIADATVQDETTLVLTGKAAGSTNLIVLDGDGKEIANSTVRVSSNTQQLTTVFYGGERQTYSCASTCEQVISVGDEKVAFENATTQIQTRAAFAAGGPPPAQ